MKSFAIITLAAFAVTGTFAQTVSDEDAAARVEEVRLMEEARAVERLAVEEARRAASRPHCTCPYGTVDSDVQCFEGEDPVACNPFIGCDPRDDTGEHQLIRKPDGRAYCTPAVFSCECDNGWVDPTATCYSYQEQACTACRDPLSHQLILIEETGHKFCTPHTYPCTCRGGIPLENPSKPCYLDGQVSCASCDSQDFILTRMRNSHHYCHFVDDECHPDKCIDWKCKGRVRWDPSWCTCYNEDVNYADYGCVDDNSEELEDNCGCNPPTAPPTVFSS